MSLMTLPANVVVIVQMTLRTMHLGAVVTGSRPLTPLDPHVNHIVEMGTQKEMGNVDTRWIVTGMQNI